jgi:hypothetical protein
MTKKTAFAFAKADGIHLTGNVSGSMGLFF